MKTYGYTFKSCLQFVGISSDYHDTGSFLRELSSCGEAKSP